MPDERWCSGTQWKQNISSPIISVEKLYSWILHGLLVVTDYFAVLAAVMTAFLVRSQYIPLVYQDFSGRDIYMYIVVPLAFLFFLHFDRLYVRKIYFWQQAQRLFKSSVYAMLLVLVVLYFSGAAKGISRIFVFATWVFGFSYLLIGRYVIKRVILAVNALQVPVIIIGAGKTAELLLESFHNNMGLGYRVVGFIEDNPQSCKILQEYPVLGNFASAEDIIQQTGVRNILIAAPGLNREELLNLVYRLQPYVNNVTFVPDLFGVPVGSMELETLFNEKIVLLKIRNNLAQVHNRGIKWLFDSTCSLLGLVVFIPVFALISILIYIDSPGPVIFAHRRIGVGGKTFPCYKFRTMIVDAQKVLKQYLKDNPAAREEWERDYKLKNDPRITRLGAFLRRTSLDELPQFINVLKGEMSLVGPRPIVAGEIERYGDYIYDYYMVRPGITGMWQVSGRNDIDYPERVQMDSWYVRNWSLWLDVSIIFRTIKVVVAKKGAY